MQNQQYAKAIPLINANSKSFEKKKINFSKTKKNFII